MPDRYTYRGTEVLRNMPGIENPLAARELETEVAYYRLVELAAHPIVGDFDLAHWQAIHQHVYQDLWEWAGQLRTVDTGTTNTALAHCRPEFIADQARIIFDGIQRDDYLKSMDRDTVADRLAYHWGETTALHPFRDGNSRSSRAFFHQLTREAGWSIDWQMVNDEMDQFKRARLIAHAGNHEPLRDMLAPTLSPADKTAPPVGLAAPSPANRLRPSDRPSPTPHQKPTGHSRRSEAIVRHPVVADPSHTRKAMNRRLTQVERFRRGSDFCARSEPAT